MSTITIINNCKNSELVRIAIYRKPVIFPTMNSIAWRIVAPPPNGGQTIINIPTSYQVYANYYTDTNDRDNPYGGNRTQVLNFSEDTARFIVGSAASADQHIVAATITQSFDGLVMNEVRIENQFGTGVWSHIALGGDDIYPPQVLPPGMVRMEDIRGSFYLAVVAPFLTSGNRLVDEEISLTQTQLLTGGTATVSGSMWDGYQITT